MPVLAIFALQAAASRIMVTESDLTSVVQAVPDTLRTNYINGQLLLLAAGQPAIALEDDLEFSAVQWLEAIPELIAGRTFEMIFSDAPGRVALIPKEGGTLVVAGDTGASEPFVAPMGEVLSAVLACWHRFQTFALAHLAPDENTAERLHQLDHWLAEADAALAGVPPR